jgi:hypothetical protein
MSPEFDVFIHAVEVEDGLGVGGVGEADAADHEPSTIVDSGCEITGAKSGTGY